MRGRARLLALAGLVLSSIVSVVFGLVVFPPSASAKVFASQKQAIAEAFPDATRIDRKTRVLRHAEAEKIEALTYEKQSARVVVFHEAYKGDTFLGVAHIDVHTVRTQPEAFMIVLSPKGEVADIRVLAFHEPLDYLPTDRWYEQLVGKKKGDALRIGGDIHGVVGATLSARAAADGVRRMLAYWEILLKPTLPSLGTEASD